ncbi:nuclear transport factor 2 family protein [Albidovulum aquaemixtae]|nr:nuclear transport factor 2 family protein [Defluviimonas aquaemixtae]
MREILACERHVWDALVAGDATADDAALHDGFLGVYPDGFSDKAGHVAQLADGPKVRSYELTDLRLMRFGDEHVLLAYHARFTRTLSHEREEMFVSSVWRRVPDGWINLFSQDTPATGMQVP